MRPYYRAWLDRWPDVRALAAADAADVIRAWAGLGYNRRAVNLQRAAGEAARRFGDVPADVADLLSLPGVGPYTASAVACFASDAAIPVLDTNIARVVARTRIGVAAARESSPAALTAAARELLPTGSARDHNLALMDLGATVCTARQPLCGGCPLIAHCAWHGTGGPAPALPPRRPAPPFETTARYARGRILAALRDAIRPLHESEVAALLPGRHAPDAGSHLAALERDGLAVRVAGGWSLPITAG